MLNIAICDDDIQITGKIERLLQDIAKRNFVDTEIEVFWNGKSLADAIAAGAYDYIETIDNTRKYKKKIENLILWNWYIKKHTSAKKRQC